MLSAESIVHGPLRDQVREVLLGRLTDGSIAPGTRLRDQAIAEELGVSRTPVREALASLVEEGLVRAIPNRGFRVPPFVRRVPLEVYPLIWTLETFALEEIPHFTPDRIEALRELNRRLADQSSPLERLRLDDAWHQTLLEPCDNEQLRTVLGSFKQQVRRYEVTFLRDAGRAALSIDDHETIAAALERGDRPEASEALRRNWSFTMDTILAWLPDREE